MQKAKENPYAQARSKSEAVKTGKKEGILDIEICKAAFGHLMPQNWTEYKKLWILASWLLSNNRLTYLDRKRAPESKNGKRKGPENHTKHFGEEIFQAF